MNTLILMAGVAALMAFSALAHAEPDFNHPPPPPLESDSGMPLVKPGLQERMSPEQCKRLYRELNDEARKAYPDHEQMELRREKMREKMHERLLQTDQNRDGAITRAEAEKNMPGLARHFDQIDTDGDGIITREEIQAAHEKMRVLREQRQQSSSKDIKPPRGDENQN